MIEIYYGMSGAFKGSTIKKKKKKTMWSLIKPWKYFQDGAFNGMLEYNDLMYGILHLTELQRFIKDVKDQEDCIIERGVTDTLFFYKRHNNLPEEKIVQILKEELNILKDYDVKRTLLIQEDYDYVKDIILKNPYRSKSFNGVGEYKTLQDAYVDFTCRVNPIDEVVRIKNARDYIENTLGETFNPENL